MTDYPASPPISPDDPRIVWLSVPFLDGKFEEIAYYPWPVELKAIRYRGALAGGGEAGA